MIARLKLVEPCNEVVSIAPAYDDRALIGARAMPTRQPNADLQMLADLINKPIEELISQAVNLPIWRGTHRQDLPSFVRTRGGVS